MADGNVYVKITMTTPGCPLHESISRSAEEAVRQLPGVESVKVDLVWDPPWTPDRRCSSAVTIAPVVCADCTIPVQATPDF